jgi:hypothetical protein
LDALLITESNNYTYLSGGHGDFSFSRPTVMALAQKRDPVVMVHDFFDASQHRESWVEDIRPNTSMLDFPVELLQNVFNDLRINTGKLGAELGREQRLGLPYNDFVKITKELRKEK